MILKQLRFTDFRNYSKKEFEFNGKTTLIVGQNTVGKTNLLEGIYLLATGKSFKAGIESEMIAWEKEVGRVKGRVLNAETTDLEILLTRGEVSGEKVARKKFFINGITRRMLDFVGNLKAVYFRPEDLDLVTDTPSIRRRYLDSVLIQVDKEYLRSLLSYEKGVRQRNKLLERIRETGVPRSQLMFWDQLLIKNGEYITKIREEFINYCNSQHATRKTQNVSRITFPVLRNYQLEYDKSIISPTRLEEYAEEEIAAGATLVGPHRDDFTFEIRNTGNETRNLRAYGSRGEQRLGVLWLKLAELEYIDFKVKDRPILLLDDIFSELDKEHRRLVLDIIPNQQTFITTTDIDSVEKKALKEIEIIQL